MVYQFLHQAVSFFSFYAGIFMLSAVPAAVFIYVLDRDAFGGKLRQNNKAFIFVVLLATAAIFSVMALFLSFV